jgi:hypothetical protein
VVDGLVGDGLERQQAQARVDAVIRTAEEQRLTSGAIVPAAIAALIVAAVGAVVWGLVIVWTGYEVGFLAVGLGFLTGMAAVIGSRGKRGLALQVVAVVAALLGIVFGKYYAFVEIGKDAVEEDLGPGAAAGISLFDPEIFRFFVESLDEIVSGFDLLWIALAAYMAWRIPKSIGLRTAQVGPLGPLSPE